MLQYDAQSLLELQAFRFTGGAIDACWKGGVHGPVDILFIFLHILLTALQLILCPLSPIGSICASHFSPF
jgi:hypothetical protein